MEATQARLMLKCYIVGNHVSRQGVYVNGISIRADRTFIRSFLCEKICIITFKSLMYLGNRILVDKMKSV